MGEAQGEPGRHCSHLVYFIARPDGHAADGGITNLPGITLPFLASRASVLQLGIHEFAASAGGSASSSPCRGGDRKGEARTDPRTANSERCFRMSLSRGEALCCSAMGVARRTVRHHPVGVKSYTGRDHPVIYVDVRLQKVGIRRTSREFPHKLAPWPPFPPAPPPWRAGPTRPREGGDPWHLPWERPGLRDRGVSA